MNQYQTRSFLLKLLLPYQYPRSSYLQILSTNLQSMSQNLSATPNTYFRVLSNCFPYSCKLESVYFIIRRNQAKSSYWLRFIIDFIISSGSYSYIGIGFEQKSRCIIFVSYSYIGFFYLLTYCPSPIPVKNVPAQDFRFTPLAFFVGTSKQLFLATWILSLFEFVTCLAFDKRFVNESNYELRDGKPNSSIDCFGSCYNVANFDIRSFCIIMIFPFILDFEFRCFCIPILRIFRFINFTHFISKNNKHLFMLTRPASTNSKKPLNNPVTIALKKPVAAKCFICNQMFHQQVLFDLHMDQHQKKVNKNLPEEIQRKTAESFGLKKKQGMSKKNSTLEAINLYQTMDKKLLNKTMKHPLTIVQPLQNPFQRKLGQTKSSMIKKPSLKPEQINKKQEEKRQIFESPSKIFMGDDKQIAQIDEVIKESSILISQMALITERYQNNYAIFMNEDARSDDEDLEESNETIQKNVAGHQFITQMKVNNWSLTKIENKLLEVNFTNYQSLQNCQIQIQFLKKVSKYSTDSKSIESMNKIKSKILAQVIKIIMSEEAQKIASETFEKNSPNKQIKQEQNFLPRTCAQCLDMIGFGETCIIQGDQTYHKDCFL